MAENYREQQQEEAEGIVDAGGFENEPGTGMVAENQETAAAAEADAVPAPEAAAPYDAAAVEQAAEEAEAAEEVHVDLHEETGSGIDIAVVIIVLLIVIGCIGFAFMNATSASSSQIIAEQQAAPKAEYVASYAVAELPEGVAAVVNGEVIEEGTVNDYFVGFRRSYGLESEGDWAAWLLAYDYTPEEVRDLAITTYVESALVRQAVDEYGIEVSQEAVDAIYDEMRSHFETDEDWAAGLEEANITEEQFVEQCWDQAATEALQEYLGEHLYATPEEADAELLTAVKTYYPEYADTESLDGIPDEILDPIREMMVYYAQQEAWSKFLEERTTADHVTMSAMPSDVPYNANLLLGLIQGIGNQLAMAQAEQGVADQG